MRFNLTKKSLCAWSRGKLSVSNMNLINTPSAHLKLLPRLFMLEKFRIVVQSQTCLKAFYRQE